MILGSFAATYLNILILSGDNKMPITIVLKGGTGSGDFGHAGIPGHLGGSAPSGTMGESIDKLVEHNKYSDMTFEEATDAIRADAKAGDFSGGWHKEYSGFDSKATLAMPDGGRASVMIITEQYVAGKYVAGTTSQQRYNVTIRLNISKKDLSKESGFKRYTYEDLWQVKTKYDGLNNAKERAKKKFDAMFK